MNLKNEIIAGQQFLATLTPKLQAYALIGSAMYLPDPHDVDFAVLLKEGEDAMSFGAELTQDGWGNCGDYDSAHGIWCAVRNGHINLMITHDKGFYDRYLTAMEVCKALNLKDKVHRIMVCQIVRDGRTADQVHGKPTGRIPKIESQDDEL